MSTVPNTKPRDEPMKSPIMKYFAYAHLPGHLQSVSQPIADLAELMDNNLPDCAEKSAGMRKLLEAKDCFVRAALLRLPVTGSVTGSVIWVLIDNGLTVRKWAEQYMPEYRTKENNHG
jgi:hypothetical protein